MRRSNCFFFALSLWMRRGGYIRLRRVHAPLPYGWHWSWSQDGVRFVHFEPVSRKQTTASAALHKLWFIGRIRRYDNHWGRPETDPRLSSKAKSSAHGERRRERRRRKDRRALPAFASRTGFHFGGDDRLGPTTVG
jgi:hypothetical protein